MIDPRYIRTRTVGAVLAAVVTCASLVIGYIIASRNDLGDKGEDYQNEFYDKPYTRIAP